jgi:hypothetical protein
MMKIRKSAAPAWMVVKPALLLRTPPVLQKPATVVKMGTNSKERSVYHARQRSSSQELWRVRVAHAHPA